MQEIRCFLPAGNLIINTGHIQYPGRGTTEDRQHDPHRDRDIRIDFPGRSGPGGGPVPEVRGRLGGPLHVQEATLQGMTFMPSVAYRVSPQISIGAGLGIMYAMFKDTVSRIGWPCWRTSAGSNGRNSGRSMAASSTTPPGASRRIWATRTPGPELQVLGAVSPRLPDVGKGIAL
jgi:hypothetical protein